MIELDFTDTDTMVGEFIKLDVNEVFDFLSRINFMYVTTSLDDIAQFIFKVCSLVSDRMIIFECAKIICEHYNKFIDYRKEGYVIVDRLCSALTYESDFSYTKSVVLYLLQSRNHVIKANKYLHKIVMSESYPLSYRYSLANDVNNMDIIQSTKNATRMNIFTSVLKMWTPGMYTVMSASSILNTINSISAAVDKAKSYAITYLCNICFTSTDYNLRADAADTLMHCDDIELQIIGENVIDELSGGNLYYTNAQNVHIKSIEQSCENNIKLLYSKVHITKDIFTVIEEIKDLGILSDESHDQIFSRILYDTASYTALKVNLMTLVCKVWSYIRTSQSKDELQRRLCEELDDAKGLCSSGFMARIINSLSGFDDFCVAIDYEDQISSYFMNRVNRLSETNDVLIEELAEGEGKNVREFVVKNLPSIRQGMYEEFKDYISDTDFDLYFKKAYLRYYNF